MSVITNSLYGEKRKLVPNQHILNTPSKKRSGQELFQQVLRPVDDLNIAKICRDYSRMPLNDEVMDAVFKIAKVNRLDARDTEVVVGLGW